jgi:hypothetical protein
LLWDVKYEGRGFALIEALACGFIPIVTEIASFRVITNQNKIGALWSAGNAAALQAAHRSLQPKKYFNGSWEFRNYFHHHRSDPAIANQALSAYHQVLEKYQ